MEETGVSKAEERSEVGSQEPIGPKETVRNYPEFKLLFLTIYFVT